MAKRKAPDTIDQPAGTPTKRRRETIHTPLTNGVHDTEVETQTGNGKKSARKSTTTSTPKRARSSAQAILDEEDTVNDHNSPTPKPNGRTLFATPKKNSTISRTPSKSKKADRSAKRKSAQLLSQSQDEDDWDGQGALARAILEDENEEEDNDEAGPERGVEEPSENAADTPVKTPNKRGRPKGAKNKRSPTPEGDIPPEERYFFQNRSGPPQISSNKFNSVKSLSYDQYHDHVQAYQDHHEPERSQLMKLHARSFPQWQYEFSQDFGLCLYGYGSKRKIVNNFAEWLHNHSPIPPRIVIVNGYTPKLTVRGVINAIASALLDEEERPLRLVGQPQEMVDALFSYMEDHPPRGQLLLMVNSIDAHPLRRSSAQSVLARLAAHPLISFLATADSPTFPTLWNSSLLDQFKYVFHDCTTFAPYTAEINVVDEVHELLGRKKLRTGGKDGIGFVLKSLPENARNLYRVLLSEILAILSDGIEGGFDGEEERRPTKRSQKEEAEEVGIEYRTLYQKASEEFICSSSMNFQFLLKEFHDHQMITSRRDASGTEMLGVPLAKEGMEAVLEELVL